MAVIPLALSRFCLDTSAYSQFKRGDRQLYGEIVVALRRSGTPLPTNDIWIAAAAARSGATVLTYDSQFASIQRTGSVVLSPADGGSPLAWSRRRMAKGMNVARVALWLTLALLLGLGLWLTRLGMRIPSVYYMTGASMEPTVGAGEYFIAWRPPGEIERGDLVIFRYEDEDGEFHVLRRVAALTGDTIAMDSGAVILNGTRQPWPYQILQPAASRSEIAIEGSLYDWGPWIVPPDSVVLLADTRDVIGWPDSRFLGFIPVNDILAKARLTGDSQ